jgi:hypothetical protein
VERREQAKSLETLLLCFLRNSLPGQCHGETGQGKCQGPTVVPAAERRARLPVECDGFLDTPEQEIRLAGRVPCGGLKIGPTDALEQGGGLLEVGESFGGLFLRQGVAAQFEESEGFEQLAVGLARDGQCLLGRLVRRCKPPRSPVNGRQQGQRFGPFQRFFRVGQNGGRAAQ